MVENSDQLSIDTPEMVAIEMPLAGIGSRFVALLIDSLIWFAATVLLWVTAYEILPGIHAFSKLAEQWVVAANIILFFLLQWGYYTLFEAFWKGRTPGKRVAGIRVIQRSGRAIGLFESMARNLIRFVDALPVFYGVGVIAVFVTKQHQRLGDLAAGTLVVRERKQEEPLWGETGARSFTAPAFAPQTPSGVPAPAFVLPATGIAKLAPADLAVMEGFFARRLDLLPETRSMLAQRIADAIREKSGLEIPQDASPETFLEVTASQLRDLARMR